MSKVVDLEEYRKEKEIEDKVDEVDLDLISLLVDLDYNHEEILEIMEIKRNWDSEGEIDGECTKRVDDGVVHIKGIDSKPGEND